MIPKGSCGKGWSLEVDTDEMAWETCKVSSEVDALSLAACMPILRACEWVMGVEALISSNLV